jgi:hypothetical protein
MTTKQTNRSDSAATSVFCLGPIIARDGSEFAAFAFANGRLLQPVFAPSEGACLAEMRRRHPTATYELPHEALSVRAAIAVQLAIGHAFAPTVKPAFVNELLAAAREFFESRAWTRYDSNALLHARVEGAMSAMWECSVLGSYGQEFGIGVYLDPGTHARVHRKQDHTELTRQVSAMSITFDPEPAWAARAVEDLTKIPFVPVPMRAEKGRHKAMEGKQLLALSACLRAAASEEGLGAAAADNARVRVTLKRAT